MKTENQIGSRVSFITLYPGRKNGWKTAKYAGNLSANIQLTVNFRAKFVKKKQ